MAEQVIKNVSDVLFPRDISDRIVRVMLSSEDVPWQLKEDLLDEIVSRVVHFGYEKIPGIRQRLDKAKVDPTKITSFESYERLFPMTSVLEMSSIGQDKFERSQHTDTLVSKAPDLEVICKTALREEAGATRNEKVRGMVEINKTVADARAAYISLAGEFVRRNHLPENVFINQKQGNVANELLRSIVIPAYEIIGAQTTRLSTPEDYSQRANGATNNAGILLAGDNKAFDIKDISSFGFAISASEKHQIPGMLYIGDYNADYGLFPNLGFRMPFPHLIRAVDKNGAMYRRTDGTPDQLRQGRITIDNFFSVYELPTVWTSLKNLIKHSHDLLDLPEITARELEQYWKENLGDDYRFNDSFSKALRHAGLSSGSLLDSGNFRKLYSAVFRNYLIHSLRVGVPSEIFMLKVGLPIYASVDNNGVLHKRIPLSSVNTFGNNAYIAGNDFDLKFPPHETPYTAFNIFGGISEGKLSLPSVHPSFVNARVLNALKGRNLMGTGRDGYTVAAGVISQTDLEGMLEAALEYSEPAKQAGQSAKLSFEEASYVLSRLYREIESELRRAYRNEPSMISVFLDNTRIPISEITGMVERIKKDFVDNNGIGVKRMIYAAFVDGKADVASLDEATLDEGMRVLAKTVPRSPTFMVTPGNITLYDSFCLFAQILNVKQSDESKKRFTMYVRPSESDIVFNFLLYKFHEIAREMDPDNSKGLRSMFQKAYWDRQYDDGALRKAMSHAESGIYYGTSRTYTEARFMAALDVASKKFSKDAVQKLKDIGLKMNYGLDSLEQAVKQGVDKDLVGGVKKFLSNHAIFPETLNAVIITPDASDMELYVKNILQQVISTRGADCTNLKRAWIPANLYESFMQIFEREAAQLTYGSVVDPRTQLAQYESEYLKGTQTIISGRKDTKIIRAVNAETGKPAPKEIDPDKNYTGVILTAVDAKTLTDSETPESDVYLEHLSKEQPLPWLNLVKYDDMQQALASMELVRQKYEQRSGYPRYLYISGMGNGQVNELERKLAEKGITDLFKKGEEAFRQFIYYRPHQGGFFINALVQS